jgi:hypothetical protein
VADLSNGPASGQHFSAEQIEVVGEVLKELRSGCASCSTWACTT